jgi:uncharacterized protein YcgI (DUF1989 family)
MSSDTQLNIVPPRRGRAVKLSCGQALKIVNTHGTQVVDTWCFNADDMKEFMSMEHHRAVTQSVRRHIKWDIGLI